MHSKSTGVTVFRNGMVFRADAARSFAGAVAVEDGVIVAVGGPDDIAPYLPGAREVIDLDGRLLAPGFTDAHAHPIRGGLERLRCDLLPGSSLEEYQRMVLAYARSNPCRTWIIGGGWQLEAFSAQPPRREQLDALVPERPVCLPDAGHHSTWVNSRALELAGIDEQTPDPFDGRIERDTDGRPTGLLHEGAGRLVEHLIPLDTPAEYDAALREAQRFLHSHGIVGWQDAMVLRPGPGATSHETYLRAQEEGWLTARVVAALWWDRDCPVEEITANVSELVAARADARGRGDRYSARAVKIMLDGVIETRTASVLEPYRDRCGHPTDGVGLQFIEPEVLKRVVTELDRVGFQVHFHALGDRAVRDALNAVEVAQQTNGTGDRRHQIAHLQLVHPDDAPRFRRLGVAANLQALWASHDPQTDSMTLSSLSDERARSQYPFGALLRDGATLVMGSDWPVSDAEPLAALHTAVNRTRYDLGVSAPPLGMEHALPLSTALAAYTAGSAWVNGDENGGTITVGNRADLVVLDRDPFDLPPEEIGSCRVERTYVGGVLVHER